jgi:hypothetical protein
MRQLTRGKQEVVAVDESVLYSEEQRFYPWLIWLIIIAFAIAIIIPLSVGVSFSHSSIWITMLTYAILIVVFWLFRKLMVVITPTQLIFGFPIWKKKLRLDTIMVGSVVKIPFIAGAGIHCWGGKTFINARMGKGVEVTSNEKTYVIGSDGPDTLLESVRSAVANWRGQ